MRGIVLAMIAGAGLVGAALIAEHAEAMPPAAPAGVGPAAAGAATPQRIYWVCDWTYWAGQRCWWRYPAYYPYQYYYRPYLYRPYARWRGHRHW